MFRLFCIRLGQILLCPVLDGCGDLPIFHILPGVLADFIGDQLVCLVLDFRRLGSDNACCRIVDVNRFIVDDFRSLIRDHLCLIGQRFFCRDRDILRFHHDSIDTLLEGRAFSRSIFHSGADLIRRHIQRACGGSIARRSLHAFPCLDREVSGVGTILIGYAELIRIDAPRGDLVAIDLRRGRTTIRDCRCIIFKGGSISIGRHFRVVYLIGNAGTCRIGDGILCIVYDIFPDKTYHAIRGCNGHVVLVLKDNSRAGAIYNSRLDAAFLLIDHGIRLVPVGHNRINRYAVIFRMDTADASFRTIGHGASQIIYILNGSRGISIAIRDFRGSRIHRLGFRILQSTFDEVISGFISTSDVLSFFSCSFDADISSGLSCYLGFRISTIVIINGIDHTAGSIAFDIRSRGGLCTAYIGSLITSHIGFLSTLEVFSQFSFYGFCLSSLYIMDFIATYRGSEILLVVFGHIFCYRFVLVTRNGSRLVAGDIVDLTAGDIVDLTFCHGISLFPIDSMIFHTIDSGIKSAITFCSLSAHSRIHGICLVLNMICIVRDGAVFRGIGDIELILLCRGLTVFTLDGFIISLCRIDGTIGILTIFVFQIGLVFAGGLRSRAGVAILVCDDIFGLCLRLCAVVRVVPILHVIHDDIRCLLMEALIARCTIGKPDFVFFCIESGRAGNRFSCPIDYKILRGYFAMIDFSVVIGRLVPENHLVRGDGTSDFQIAINLGFFQIGLPIGHGQTFIHIHRFIEIRGSVYRHRVRRIRAEGDVAFKVSILCGRDLFSRQLIHIFDIALFIHFDTVFDGGLGVFCVPFDTAGAIIGILQFFIQRGQILGNRISILHICSSRIIDVSDLRIDFRICLCSCLSFCLQCSIGVPQFCIEMIVCVHQLLINLSDCIRIGSDTTRQSSVSYFTVCDFLH